MKKRKFYTCGWVFDTLIVLCDGKVVCGCDDPFGLRVLGNIKEQTVEEIWNSEKVQKIRKELNEGYSSFCGNCCIKEEVDCQEDIEQRDLIQPKVLKLFLEPTVICNLKCHEARCGAGGVVASSRSSRMMSLADFKMVLDQVGEGLERINFYNYGEAFVNPEAVDMVEYVKSEYPSVHFFSCTNLLMLNEEKIDRLVKAGIDEITASVDGCDQESYSKYRCGGSFDKVVSIFETFVEKKKKYNRSTPYISWKYILFKWNSSDSQMQKATEIAEKTGINRLFWDVTDWPASAKSSKYQMGSRGWKKIRHETLGAGRVCNAIKSKKYLADIELPNSKKMKVGASGHLKAKIVNKSIVMWSDIDREFGNHFYLGAQLLDKDKNLLENHYALAPLDEIPLVGGFVERDIILPPLKEAGKYYLRFDITTDGVGWFGEGGSKSRLVKLSIVNNSYRLDREEDNYASDIDLPQEIYEIDAGTSGKIGVGVRNVGRAVWKNVSNTPSGWVRLGIQLYDEEKNVLDLEYSRSYISKTLENGDFDHIGAGLPAIKNPGKYYLKFDMVIEGVSWFEKLGSPVKWIKLKVN